MNPGNPTEKQLITLSRIAASATQNDQFNTAAALQIGADSGFSLEQLYEGLLQLLTYIGYPRTIHALMTFHTTFPTYSATQESRPLEPWTGAAGIVWPDRGESIFKALWGGDALTKSRLSELSPELAEWIIADTFGRITGRPALNLLEREAIVIGSLIAQDASREIATHRRAVLNMGGYEGLVEALIEGVNDLVPADLYIRARETMDHMISGSATRVMRSTTAGMTVRLPQAEAGSAEGGRRWHKQESDNSN
ncbi:MAG: hypothetical protein ABI743_05260 [bacterium]